MPQPALNLSVEFPVEDYDLAATLASGQAFRWRLLNDAWEGVVDSRWVRLQAQDDSSRRREEADSDPPRSRRREEADSNSPLVRPGAQPNQLSAQTAVPVSDWQWLRHYLQLDVNLAQIQKEFPDDQPMQAAVKACPGLRILRQEPWECLASFICSSSKQIVQIQQITALLGQRFGQPVAVPPGHSPAYAFPTCHRLAEASEAALRDCKMGFRAPYLLAAARKLSAGQMDLTALRELPFCEARGQLLRLPGVGPKIADCVLLFACGFQQAFPVDVWILKALRQLYFPRRRVKPPRLRRFAETYFGPYAGYAQQYLFHYMRVKGGGV